MTWFICLPSCNDDTATYTYDERVTYYSTPISRAYSSAFPERPVSCNERYIDGSSRVFSSCANYRDHSKLMIYTFVQTAAFVFPDTFLTFVDEVNWKSFDSINLFPCEHSTWLCGGPLLKVIHHVFYNRNVVNFYSSKCHKH